MKSVILLSFLLGAFGFVKIQNVPQKFVSVSLQASNEPTKVEQDVKDLNLEQMFDVFEEADKKVKLPKGQTYNSFDATKQVGSSSPFGYFDPAGFTSDITEDQFKLYQEAEIKHGRVSMLSFVGIVFGELLQNGGIFFNGEITGPAIYQYQQADAVFPFTPMVLAIIAAVEVSTILNAWIPLGETLKEPSGLAKLRSDYTPGMLGFDPLGFLPKDAKQASTIRVKEINNGRLAMLAVAGIVAQELVTGSPIF